MTGYGQSINKNPEFSVKIEIKAVNNKYLDAKVKLPRELYPLEQEILSVVRNRIKRGSITIFINISGKIISQSKLKIDQNMVKQIMDISNELEKKYSLAGLKINDILTFPQVFETERAETDIDKMRQLIMPVLKESIEVFDHTRIKEGKILKTDLLNNIEKLKKLYSDLLELLPKILEAIKEKFLKKIEILSNEIEFDKSRMEQEICFLMEKADINEEIVRISAHLGNLETIICNGGSCGKKIDFYLQELNREINTSLSKLKHVDTGKLLLNMKETTEKIREQVQNIE